MKHVSWHRFDKQNKLAAKPLCDDTISTDYEIMQADYDVIIHCLKHLVYNFMRFSNT